MTESYRRKIEGSLTINETISEERLEEMKYKNSCGHLPWLQDVAALIATVEAYRQAPDERDQELSDANERACDAEIVSDKIRESRQRLAVELDKIMRILEGATASFNTHELKRIAAMVRTEINKEGAGITAEDAKKLTDAACIKREEIDALMPLVESKTEESIDTKAPRVGGGDDHAIFDRLTPPLKWHG